MRKTFFLPAALLAGLGLSLAAYAYGHGQDDGYDEGPHHAMHEAMHMLHQLDLSTDQRDQIHALIEGAFKDFHAERASLRQMHHQVMVTPPDSPDFAPAVSQLADAEANAARARVQRHAELKTKIYAILTDAQKAKLADLIAQHEAAHQEHSAQ
jgi:Spy/CpxP family protein refolding chaperone